MTAQHLAIAASGGLALALALTACSAAGSHEAAVSPTPTAERVILPAGFPVTKVPLIEGPIMHASHPGNIWTAFIGSTDLITDLSAATALLSAAGYEHTDGGEHHADFHGPDYEVRIFATVDPLYGSTISYTIVEKATS